MNLNRIYSNLLRSLFPPPSPPKKTKGNLKSYETKQKKIRMGYFFREDFFLGRFFLRGFFFEGAFLGSNLMAGVLPDTNVHLVLINHLCH